MLPDAASVPVVDAEPELLRSASTTHWNGVPEHAIWKKIGDALSIFRVIENGLNVTLPAPAPFDWLPMFSVCSMSKLKSSTSKILPWVSATGCFISGSGLFAKLTCDSASSQLLPVYC